MEEYPSVRLSTLNTDLSQKLRKFDTSNDGSLSTQELISAVVTLQKQSNAYKKTIWFLIPLLICLVLSMFGMTILAIRLSKDIYVSSSSSLLSTSGVVIKTGDAFNTPVRFQAFLPNNTQSVKMNKLVSVDAPISSVKAWRTGNCYLSYSDWKYYLQLDTNKYTSINNINALDVMYLINGSPYRAYDYSIVSKTMDAVWNIHLQAYHPQCQFSFTYSCITEEFWCSYTYCTDPSVIYQCQLFTTTENYSGAEGGGGDGGGSGGDAGGDSGGDAGGGSGKSVKLSAITKVVSVKTSSYNSYLY